MGARSSTIRMYQSSCIRKRYTKEPQSLCLSWGEERDVEGSVYVTVYEAIFL